MIQALPIEAFYVRKLTINSSGNVYRKVDSGMMISGSIDYYFVLISLLYLGVYRFKLKIKF